MTGVAFADLAGFTALTERHGDEDAAELAERFCQVARASAVGEARVIKSIGDAVMLAGPQVDDVVVSVLTLIDAMFQADLSPDIRAGVHCGPVATRGDDIFGATVNIAARVAAEARPGQLLCTGEVVVELPPARRATARHLGAVELRNVRVPVEVYELQPQRPSNLVVDPVCRMRVPAAPPSLHLTISGAADEWFCSTKCLHTVLSTIVATGSAP